MGTVKRESLKKRERDKTNTDRQISEAETGNTYRDSHYTENRNLTKSENRRKMAAKTTL